MNNESKQSAPAPAKKHGLPTAGAVNTASMLFMGLAHILFLRQYVKGLFFAAVELLFLANIPLFISKLVDLVSLGNSDKVLAGATGSNTLHMLTDGILVLALFVLFAVLYVISIRSAKSIYKDYERTGKLPGNKKNLAELAERGFIATGLAPAVVLIVLFVALPILFSLLVAFTSYSAPASMPTSGNIMWVGVDNFKQLFSSSGLWSSGVLRVSLWTLIWGVVSTATCYFVGLLLALYTSSSNVRFGKVFRSILILPYAIPSMVSILVWRYMLNGSFGVVNKALISIGIIAEAIPWLSDGSIAKFVCVLVNLWAGFPFFMLLCSGVLNTIPRGSLEAAEVDGAGRLGVFFKITAPIVTRQTAPLLIIMAVQNINNFGSIFFLTQGGPVVDDTISSGAGGTDTLITWIYDLTVNLGQYNIAAALGLLIFLIIVPFAIIYLVNTKSFKEGRLYE